MSPRQLAMALYGCWMLRRAIVLLAGGRNDLGLTYARHAQDYFEPC